MTDPLAGARLLYAAAHDDVDSESEGSRMAVPLSARHLYPMNMTVDFTKLRANALRRYMAHHGIQELPGSSKEQLAIVVARHFNDECKLTDEETSIAAFLSYIKGSHVPDSDGSDSDVSGARSNRFTGAKDVEMRCSNEAMEEEDDDSDSDDEENSLDDETSSDSLPTKRRKSSTGGYGHTLPSSRSRSVTKSSSSSSSTQHNKKNKKKRKTRLYCVCKGSSFGDMIACDNKTCVDRSNWFHMSCVGLDPRRDPPETWYCPSCQDNEAADIPENQYRKPVASVTYGDMISHALTVLPDGKGTFKEICDFVEKQYESQLNWKLESDQRKSPVWKSSVRKILFSNVRFRKHPDDKGLFCLAA
ncbi:hypothetical protein Poli38472_012263 [Pythium oligandrum]|uniref:PHD-type domain-containing protein n=1 Tax=Pythium oligandrum TaxID=41045 RepID=A0A8K1CP40_PYTOL|nr:hypothetical protein Poli38472_012263 [Pythium oligandrum]|eukprot:TMW67147.1 hypothetical protein Poli38472_012263 [Pythium oligandrum]